ncbi:MAG: thiamine diphosphokinase [Marinicellaceae bacterium]
MKKAALFLNGEKPKVIANLAKYDQVFCTDGAYDFLSSSHITPDLIIGDFDSIETLPVHIAHKHTPDQNFTDFEKALKYIICQDYLKVDVFAANGLEQDHFLGNLTTALKYKSKIRITFYDDHHRYFFMDKKIKIDGVLNKIVSLFPFSKATKVYSKGLQYPLNGRTLNIKNNNIGTRNKAVKNKIKIQFKKGNLLLFVEI